MWDDQPVAIADLGSNFFLSSTDVGNNRVDASLAKLKALNSHVKVEKVEGQLSVDLMSGYDVVAFTECPHDINTLQDWN